jgi:Flp pilus assembly protein TadG
MSGVMKAASKMWLRARRSIRDMLEDRSAIAATEFAVIVPVMLTLFFGTVEFSSGVAVDRKVTLIARTLADITSQAASASANSVSASVTDSYLQNVFTASIAIMMPYSPTPTTAQLSEIYVDSTGKAVIQWSIAAIISGGATQAALMPSTHSPGDDVTHNVGIGPTPASVPPQLLVKQTYLILSEVNYLYTPVGALHVVMKSNLNLSDVGYSRPRQATCVIYTTPTPNQPPPDPNTGALCPTTK